MDERNENNYNTEHNSYQNDTGWQSAPDGVNYTQGASSYGNNSYGSSSYGGSSGGWEQDRKPSPGGSGFGIASMVLGILSIVLSCTCINIPMAILAIIFAVVHFGRNGSNRGFGIAGIVTAVLSLVLTVLLWILVAVTGFSAYGLTGSGAWPIEEYVTDDGFYYPDEPQDYLDDMDGTDL